MKNDSFLLINCNLVNVNEGSVLEKAAIRVKEGKIITFGQDMKPAKNEKVIDLHGDYVCPGLIDAHVHLFGNGVPKKVIASKGNSQKRLVKFAATGLGQIVLHSLAKASLQQSLRSGTTTVRSLGDLHYADEWAKKAIKEGKFLGPRVLSSGYAVTTPDGHGVGSISKGCTTKEEFVAAIDENIKHGCDWVKLMVTSGAMDALPGEIPGAPRMSLEQIKWCVDYAHKKGFRVSAHCESSEGFALCIKGGIDTIEHGAILDREMMEGLSAYRSRLITTLSPALPAALLDKSVSKYSEGQLLAVSKIYEGVVSSAKSCYQMGIKVGLGTDASCPFATHSSMWRELCYYKKTVGCSNAEALYAGTLGNARILGIDDVTGSIDLNKDADLIVLKGNPLEDLTTLDDVQMVFIKGVKESHKQKRFKKLEKELNDLI